VPRLTCRPEPVLSVLIIADGPLIRARRRPAGNWFISLYGSVGVRWGGIPAVPRLGLQRAAVDEKANVERFAGQGGADPQPFTDGRFPRPESATMPRR
jgi:hypothetical protein